MEELTGLDYLYRPLAELMRHSDFSEAAFRNVRIFTTMKTSQLETLNFGKG